MTTKRKITITIGLGVLLIVFIGAYMLRTEPSRAPGMAQGGGGGGPDFIGNYLPDGQTITQFEGQVGHSIQIENQGESFGSDWGTKSPEEQADIRAGVIPMISLKPDGGLGNTCVKLQDIASGLYDNTWTNNGGSHPGLTQIARTFASWKTPVMIRFFKEFTDTEADDCVYGTSHPAGDPQVYGPLFVTAWQHVVNVFKANGATNVQWIWGPGVGLLSNHNGSPDDVTWRYFYPGNNYVDWVSNDLYNKSTTTLQDYNQKLELINWYNLIQQTDKPMMQAETGAGYNAQTQPNDSMNFWLRSAYAALTSATTTNPMPKIRAFIWWGAPGVADYVLQGAGLETYAKMAADPHFNAATSSITQYATSAGSSAGPSTPANLAATPARTSIALTWSASTDKNGTVACYDVYRALLGATTTTEIATTTATSYTDTSVRSGTTYLYTVDALDNTLNRSLQSGATHPVRSI